MASNRKQELLALLKGAKEAINGQSLAEHFGVTRQIIVQDIALLRAAVPHTQVQHLRR